MSGWLPPFPSGPSMSDESPTGPAAARPVQNMRVTFWGVQGSCPINPTPYGIQEYSRRLAIYTLGRAFEDLQKLSKKYADGRVNLNDLFGGPPTRQAIEAYQRQIGLPDLPIYGGETTCIE